MLLLTSHKPLPSVCLYVKWPYNTHILCIAAASTKFSVIAIHSAMLHGIFPFPFPWEEDSAAVQPRNNYYVLATVVCIGSASFCRTHIGLIG